MGSKSTPAPPDYTGAANAQAAASKENVVTQNYANRPDIYTPWGAQTWDAYAKTDPATGQSVTQWNQNVSLAPELQNALNSQIATQQGRSNLASGFMQRVGNEYSQPFDWQNLPQMTAANAPQNLTTSATDYTPGLTTDVPTNNNALVSGFSFGGPQMNVNSMAGNLSYGVGNTNVQNQLATGDNPAIPQFDASYRDRIAGSLMDRMVPVQDYQRKQLETQLSNQGFKVGTEGYRRALDEMNQRQAAERYNALDTAGNEAQRLYNMQMGSAQQAFNQDLSQGQFYNAAQGQQFGQGLQAGQFQNQAVGQGFNQMLGAGNFGNNAQNQLYQQMMGQANLANQTNQQGFNQNLQAAQLRNSAMGQASSLDLARMQAQNQARQQQFGMNTQYADQMNRLRQQAIAEQAQRRGMSLNEMNALLSGQQVAMPQFPSFSQAGQAQAPDLLTAAKYGYDASMDAYNAQQGGLGGMLGGLGSIAGAAMPLFGLSDIRLKSNIERVGTHPVGVGVYEYDIFDRRERGVIAQELQAVRPELVATHPSGYLMVNYGALNGG